MDRERHKMLMQKLLIDVEFWLSEKCADRIITDMLYLASDTHLTNQVRRGSVWSQVLPERD